MNLEHPTRIVQLTAALIAIPVGLAGAFSFYNNQISAEGVCDNLRGNLLGIIDRNVPADVKYASMHRDFEHFEKKCARHRSGCPHRLSLRRCRACSRRIACRISRSRPAADPSGLDSIAGGRVERHAGRARPDRSRSSGFRRRGSGAVGSRSAGATPATRANSISTAWPTARPSAARRHPAERAPDLAGLAGAADPRAERSRRCCRAGSPTAPASRCWRPARGCTGNGPR